MINKVKKLDNKGIAHPILFVGIVLLILILGFAIYRVYSSNKSKSKNNDDNISQQVKEFQGISQKEDIKKAVDSLNENQQKTDTKADEEALKQTLN